MAPELGVHPLQTAPLQVGTRRLIAPEGRPRHHQIAPCVSHQTFDLSIIVALAGTGYSSILRTVSRCSPNSRAASQMLIPSTITALRTRRYMSTLYIHRTIHRLNFNPMDGGGRSSLQPPFVSGYPPTWPNISPLITGWWVAATRLDFYDPAGLRRSMTGAGVLYNTYWIRFGHGRTTFEQALKSRRGSVCLQG